MLKIIVWDFGIICKKKNESNRSELLIKSKMFLISQVDWMV